MKKNIKALLLSAVILGSVVGCNETGSTTSDIRSSDNPFTSSMTSDSTTSSTTVVLTDITLNVLNVKRAYEQGEALDLTGLEVTAKYSDGSSKAVTDYTVNPTNGTVLNEIGETTVTVTYSGYSKSFKVTVSKATKKAWTEEEANIMKAHLYGEVLPYTGSEESVVSYDNEEDLVLIQGGDASGGKLGKYQDALNAAGYVRAGVNPVFEKSVNTSEGKRYIRVTTQDEDGKFVIRAYDPYYYTFPADFAKMIAKEAFYSNDIPPAFEGADYYESSTSNLAIYCYTESTTAESSYTTTLHNAGWLIGASKYKDHYFAVSPDNKYAVYYRYNTQYGSLDIYFGALFFWNTTLIQNFYNKYSGYVVDIPAFNVEGGEYVFKESDVNEQAYASELYEMIHAFMYIYGADASALPGYADTLTQNGWEVEGSGNFYKAYLTIPDKGVARLEFEYSSSHKAVIVTIYYKLDPILSKEWPENDVNEVLGTVVLGSLPKYTGERKGFTFLNDMFGIAVVVHVNKGAEEAALNHYINTDLAAAGYTLDKYGYYSKPESELSINPVIPTGGGMVTIEFAKTGSLEVFPSSAVNMYLQGNDTVPTYASDTYVPWLYSYDIVSEDTIALFCHFEQGVSEHARLAYEEILATAGYTKSSDGKTFTSPSKNFYISLSSSADYKQLIITIRGTPKSDFVSLWPTAKINQLFFAEGYTDELPSYDKVCTDITAGKNYDGSLYVLIETNDKANVKTEYCGLLANANFTYDYVSSNNYDDVYKSPNKQYSVTVSANSLGVSLIIKSLGSTVHGDAEFPMASLIADIPEAEGVVPGFWEDDTLTFSYDYYFGMAFITVYSDPALAISGALEAYKAILESKGFRFQQLYGYWDVYVSSNGKIAIELDDAKLSEGQFVIGVALVEEY